MVIVTGASSGIGEATAREFAKNGCRVVLAARREEEAFRDNERILTLEMAMRFMLKLMSALKRSVGI